MSYSTAKDKQLVMSYLELRAAIGFLGIALPFALLIGGLLVYGTGIQISISAYYYTGMRDVLVGILCVIGVFLYSYRGYKDTRADDIAGNLACFFAVGTALCPTTPEEGASRCAEIVGGFHLAFAVGFFATLIYFSLHLFTKTDQHVLPERKQQRNKIFKACGYTMAACILLIALYFLLPDETASRFEPIRPVFLLEAIAILAFGVSWFTKGGMIRGDKPGPAPAR